ncbi:PREDICTED: uncharacterized protein LOC104783438 [Camelina sativa]|uniref:Uncharacterized protein LOC104783438 n=1 Tax=Camelina sativa TaxID=90675 RepID=A0ABM0YWI0_CAMSA|nr:PREDICTED: uncharacterized protein LOC104783438 [Camelina sativa]
MAEREEEYHINHPYVVDDFDWKALIWKKEVSPKGKMFLWKLAQNALPVGENLIHRQVVTNASCPHCGSPESELHLLFQCPFAEQIWTQAPLYPRIQPPTLNSIQEGISISVKATCLPPTGIRAGPLSPWIMWATWTARNRLIFNKEKLKPGDVLSIAITRAKEWQEVQFEKSKPLTKTRKLVPPAPRNSNHWICTDAAWREDGSAGLGWEIKNPQEEPICEGSSSASHVATPLVAEALATLMAIKVVIASDLTSVSFASDSLTLVKAINKEIQVKELYEILHDILNLSTAFASAVFCFISRDFNRRADALAKESLLAGLNSVT